MKTATWRLAACLSSSHAIEDRCASTSSAAVGAGDQQVGRKHIVARSSCGVLVAVLALAVIASPAKSASIDWQTEQCWQAGQLGAEALSCENAAASGFLGSHIIDDLAGSEELKLSTSGQYCSYSGLGHLNKPEEADVFNTPIPRSDYQEGDGDGNVCAAWAPSESSSEWGLQLQNAPEDPCSGSDPDERCAMERYVSLGSQSLNDRPWANYFGNPSLGIFNAIEPLVFQQDFQEEKEGAGWGYLCAVIEETGKAKNILELCFEEWHSAYAYAEWLPTHIAECKPVYSGFEHTVDKIVLPLPETVDLINDFDEPIEETAGVVEFQAAVGARHLEELIELDNAPFKEKHEHREEDGHAAEHGERRFEPELGDGCGRDSSTTPSEWALIGVSNGLEEWESSEAKTKLLGSTVRTTFEPLPIDISPESVTGVTEDQATFTGTVNPYGFPTKYVIEYGQPYSPEHTTSEIQLGAEGTIPTSVTNTLTGLSPGTTYFLRLKAFHYNAGTISDVSYGPIQTFATVGAPCSGASVTGHGGSELSGAFAGAWSAGFNASSNKYACAGTQGTKQKPTVSYVSTSSEAGFGSWGGKDNASVSYGLANAFLGSAEPPNSPSIAEIEANETSIAPQSVDTIPVAQIAVAVFVDLPTGCSATSTGAPGRLVLANPTLEGIYHGTITKWSQIKDGGDAISGSGCNAEAAITRVVPKGQAGTTHILKRYLGLINGGLIESEKGASKTWDELAEGAENTTWPKAASVVRPTEEKTGAVETKVSETPGSIGYGNLAEVRATGLFSASKGGAGTERFWVKLENGEKGKGEDAKLTYADPATNEDVEAPANANCAKTAYTNGAEPFPPASGAASLWNEVTTSVPTAAAPLKEKNYPLCSFVYIVALSPYAAYEGTGVGEALTVKDFLQFVVDNDSGGQTLIANHDYAALPKAIASRGLLDTAEIGF
jgi:ABC-type phosphate transport system substrate-binding protein